ncbi:MAG: hypothetical protein CR965_00765 [Paludibacter sp.]|nr:MAG: hypothetical protein CR965_00765 [Paludibacter sp.]
MEIAIVITLITLSVLFFIIELFLIPGISIAGIFGGILTFGAVWYAYAKISATAGTITLIGGLLLSIVAIWLFIKSKAFDKMSLKTNVSGNSTSVPNDIKVGDKGTTLSRLAPMGKILVNNLIVEAKTNDSFIDESTEVVIKKIDKTNVLVEML